MSYALRDASPSGFFGQLSQFSNIGSTGLTRPTYVQPAAAADEFSEFDEYNFRDWDGYDADPITPETVSAARALKRMFLSDVLTPDIAPGADGTIGFEWRTGSPDRTDRIFIEVGPGDRLNAREIKHDGNVRIYSTTTVRNGGPSLLRQIFAP